MRKTIFDKNLSSFVSDESGAGNTFSLFMSMVLLGVSGVAVDGANGWRVQNIMQVTSDATAMAAASMLPDQDAALEKALKVAELNLGDNHGSAITANDIHFGEWDSESNSFIADSDVINAVYVEASRKSDRGNPVPTQVLRYFGQDRWQTSAGSIALMGASTDSTQDPLECAAATFITSNFMNTGGGNTLEGDVCVHGGTGVLTGGNDYFTTDVRISAPDIDDVTISTVASGSATAEEVKAQADLEPVILPELSNMFQERWSALYDSGITMYSGELIPSNIYDENGEAKVVRINQGWWTVQPGDLEPHTIYLVNHGMQIAGGVDAENVAILAKGQIGTGGGPALHFQDVFFFATGALNFSGATKWGNEDSYCDTGEYNSYLFSYQSLSLGGFSSQSGVYGVVGAAPRFSPGGAMRSSGGLYFEASQYTALGGNLKVTGCDAPLASEFSLAKPDIADTGTTTTASFSGYLR